MSHFNSIFKHKSIRKPFNLLPALALTHHFNFNPLRFIQYQESVFKEENIEYTR
jgi:hypothetical protein